MSDSSLANVGLAYRWLLAYYRDVAQFCGRVRAEFELYEGLYTAYPESDSIQRRTSTTFRLTQLWLPCYHYQLFSCAVEPAPGFEMDLAALLVVGIDHFDPEQPTRAEPIIYRARFGPFAPEQLKQLSRDIVYTWEVGYEETEAEGWRFGTFRDVGYSYSTLPLSAVSTLDDVPTKVIKPLVEHDNVERLKGGRALNT